MSTPPNRSTLSNYASNTNKAQAGAVAVAGAIGSTLARNAASWVSEASKTINQHLPAARSATQYYSYDAKRTSEKAYKSAKKTLRGVAGGAVKVSNWMGLDLSLPDEDNSGQQSSSSKNQRKNGDDRRGGSPIPFDSAIELGEGNLVPGEEECHYTPQPTGFGGQVEVLRVQVQMTPALVVLDQNARMKNHTNSATSSHNPNNLLAAASCNENMSSGSQSAAFLSLCLLGPGGSPGFAIFRIDCTDVYEEVVELHLPELDSLGPVKSVCVAEVLSYPRMSSSSSSSSSTATSSTNDNNNNSRMVNVLNPSPTATKLAVVLTERCILQYNISQRKVVSLQQLHFQASDLKLCSNYALVTHSGFGQISVMSLTPTSSSSSSSNKNNSNSSASKSSSGGSVVFALDEIDVIVPEGDETALSDRWLAYVGSGSEGARVSTRLLSYAQKTTAENISKHIHTGLKAVGGFLGSAVSKALQATGASNTSSSSASDDVMSKIARQQDRENNSGDIGRDDYIFNPSSVGAIPDKSDTPVGTVVIRDLSQRQDIAAFVAHENPVQTMAFDATGTILATCAVDGKHIHVFRICPKGSATATTTVSSAAAFQRLPRLPPVNDSTSANSRMFGLFGGGSSNTNGNNGNYGNNNNNQSTDDLNGSEGGTSSPNTKTPISSPTTGNNQYPQFANNSNNNSSGLTPLHSNNNSAYPNTTIVFSHRINRGMSSGTVESLSFSQPWTWLACTTTIGTAHFFKLEMDRLTNVEDNIVACESGMLPAANIHGADFRIRSAPSTVLPAPVVSFFPGEASTGAGEQATACVVTKTSTVATTVISSVNDKGVLLYERAAAHFAGSQRDGNNTKGVNNLSGIGGGGPGGDGSSGSGGSGQPRTLYKSSSNQQGGGAGGSSSAKNKDGQSKKHMTAEACWMELLHRRTQPQFAPLYDGITVELLPEPEKNKDGSDDDDSADDHQ